MNRKEAQARLTELVLERESALRDWRAASGTWRQTLRRRLRALERQVEAQYEIVDRCWS